MKKWKRSAAYAAINTLELKGANRLVADYWLSLWSNDVPPSTTTATDHDVVETAKGGKAGGGAQLTPLGKEVLIAYREMEKLTEAAVSPILRKLRRKVKRARPAER